MAVNQLTTQPYREAESTLTGALVQHASGIELSHLPPDMVQRVSLCLLDWIGVTAAARHEPVVQMLLDEAMDSGGTAQASIVAGNVRLPAVAAAMVNGSASHALELDDVNLAMTGHPSAPVIAAIAALAEREHSTGADFVAAFVAGYECSCRLAAMVGPDHYARGFHSTATIGTIGAAVACARLLRLDQSAMAQAIAIAASQAAGVRSTFGTMMKPVQVGLAASRGVLSAALARRGIKGPVDALEAPMGFLAVTGGGAAAVAAPGGGYYLRNALFKFHACCFLAHAPANAARSLRAQHSFAKSDIERVVIRVHPNVDSICNLARPLDGFGMRFSIRAVVALALTGYDTGLPENYADQLANDPVQVQLRARMRVELTDFARDTLCELVIILDNGTVLRTVTDVSAPVDSLVVLRERIERKFTVLTARSLPIEVRTGLIDATREIGSISDFVELSTRWQVSGNEQEQSGGR